MHWSPILWIIQTISRETLTQISLLSTQSLIQCLLMRLMAISEYAITDAITDLPVSHTFYCLPAVICLQPWASLLLITSGDTTEVRLLYWELRLKQQFNKNVEIIVGTDNNKIRRVSTFTKFSDSTAVATRSVISLCVLLGGSSVTAPNYLDPKPLG